MSDQKQGRQDSPRNQHQQSSRSLFTLQGIRVGVHPENLEAAKVCRRSADDVFVSGITVANGTVQVNDYRTSSVEIVEQIEAKRTELASLTEDSRLKTLREAKAKLDELKASGVNVSSTEVEDQIVAIQEGMADQVNAIKKELEVLEKDLVNAWYDNAWINIIPGDRESFVIQFGDTDFKKPNTTLMGDVIELPQSQVKYEVLSAGKKDIRGVGRSYGFIRELIDSNGNIQVVRCGEPDTLMSHTILAWAGELAGGIYVAIEVVKDKLLYRAVPCHMDLASTFGNLERKGDLAQQFVGLATKRQAEANAAKVVVEETEVAVEPPVLTSRRRGKKSDDNKEAASS